MRKTAIFILLSVLILASGCFKKQPERLNPFDPYYSKKGNITGTVVDKDNKAISKFYADIYNEHNDYISKIYGENGSFTYYNSEGTYSFNAFPNSFPTTNEYYYAIQKNVKVTASETVNLNFLVKQLFTAPVTNQSLLIANPSFSWIAYPNAQSYLLEVFKITNAALKKQWGYYGITGTTFPYPTAHSEPLLESGYRYEARLRVFIIPHTYDDNYLASYSRITSKVQ